ncbi:cholinephosphotransferase 1 isoform X2 [Eurytemora carolleeae]|uniref:cholinephosphotransferase 1 isoform X2 n=1 Tax=Eurytemora carolleeae TaxID=1294199 RepID=UPI000C793DD0|nr:cholinephosphotransferase 1 isoform X2 [Eurytemora carolleeae]|eukprot:XP_023331980.1 cholinephosphotransferase 1-like isoform X2 [Eurytemora affinis]
MINPVRILSDVQLKKLKEHKYSSSCQSLLDPAMQIFWNWIVEFVPLWVAPNLITIVGLFVNIFTSLILIAYCPTATEDAPWWTTSLCAVGLFVYQTLDAIDGKQARRTSSSNPLGELFDHGCDSLSTVFVSLASCCAVQLGRYPGWMLFQCLCASTLFYCAHWQTYVSGTLQFGKIDVTEGQLVVVCVMLLSSFSSFFNLDIWATSVFGSFLTLRDAYVATGVGIALFHLSGTLPICTSPGAGKNGSTLAGTSVLSPASPLLFVILPAWVIAYRSDEAVYHDQPILYTLMFGLIAAKITNRLVVAHMCKSEIHHRDPALLAPMMLMINQYFSTVVPEKWLLSLAMVWVVVDLLRYCGGVCLEICEYLNIFLFKIPYPPPTITNSSNGETSQGATSTRQRKKISRS